MTTTDTPSPSRRRTVVIGAGGGVFFGPDEQSANHLAGDVSAPHLAGPAGTEQRIIVPLQVDGAHDVRITAITGRDLVNRVEWSDCVFRNGGSVSDDRRPWHEFPVTVEAHQVIRLGIVLRKPADCGTGVSRPWRSFLTVQWTALGGSHTDYLNAADQYTVYGCG